MIKYKEDLDRYKNEKETINNSRSEATNLGRVESHNPLINPLPYNIQNPYLLKEMGRQIKSPQGSNR